MLHDQASMFILSGKLNYGIVQNDFIVPEAESAVRNPDGMLLPPTMHVIMVRAKMSQGDNRIMPSQSSAIQLNSFHQVEYVVTSNKHEYHVIHSYTPVVLSLL